VSRGIESGGINLWFDLFALGFFFLPALTAGPAEDVVKHAKAHPAGDVAFSFDRSSGIPGALLQCSLLVIAAWLLIPTLGKASAARRSRACRLSMAAAMARLLLVAGNAAFSLLPSEIEAIAQVQPDLPSGNSIYNSINQVICFRAKICIKTCPNPADRV